MFLSFEGGAIHSQKEDGEVAALRRLPTLPMPGSWSESRQDWGRIKRDLQSRIVLLYSFHAQRSFQIILRRGIAVVDRDGLVGVVGDREASGKLSQLSALSVFKIIGLPMKLARQLQSHCREHVSAGACDNMEESSQIAGSTNTFKLATKLHADVRIFNTARDLNFNEKIQAGTFILPCHEGQQPALDSKNGEGVWPAKYRTPSLGSKGQEVAFGVILDVIEKQQVVVIGDVLVLWLTIPEEHWSRDAMLVSVLLGSASAMHGREHGSMKVLNGLAFVNLAQLMLEQLRWAEDGQSFHFPKAVRFQRQGQGWKDLMVTPGRRWATANPSNAARQLVKAA
ncbi:hypothetical protein EI94DRAFT_1701253 [Lactarius quietus]|nr:hypothetical protein EI94DRAFT_1701253 [Lactarius quietus]